MMCNRWMCGAAAIFALVSGGTLAVAQGGGQGGGQGAAMYSTNCASCHGADGKGSDRAPGIATMQKVIAMTDAEITTIVHDGEAGGMPSFGSRLSDQQIQGIVRYLRTLQGVKPGGNAAAAPLPGDPIAGAQLFAGKAGCASCHMVKGNGGFIANDLTTYGQSHDAASIRAIILNPDAKPASGGGGGEFGGAAAAKAVTVTSKSGQKFTGMVRSEDNLRINVQTMDGNYHFLVRSQMASIVYLEHSLMPADYGTKLSAKEIDDLISYLLQTARQAPQEAAPARRRRGGN